LPLLRKIYADPELKLHLIASGMHLSPEFGLTVATIEEDGFEIAERIEMLLSSDAPEGISKSMGLGVIGFAQAYARFRPDILLVLGDRFEMYAAALAALPFKVPVAHIHGGEITQGAIDDALRHSITKLSHLHFVATRDYAKRVMQLGEEPWRVTVSGAPSLDNLSSLKLLTVDELKARYGLVFEHRPLLATFHPVTLEYEESEKQIGELLSALEAFDLPILFTMPNADTKGRIIAHRVTEFVRDRPSTKLLANLGTQGYFSVMAWAAVMVGNSSSGIVEAPSFGLPVVNIGNRQQGRIKAKNVIDVECNKDEIIRGIKEALTPEFRLCLRGVSNPYGDGHAADIIVGRLKEVKLDRCLLIKRFADIPFPVNAG
jgi:UDP-N-acetylglucosamine 2-epimerase (non-hydrolysing)/GDP/UDP-N,N'-diacetylbacillosamine 2-epimerase (hydrolysing)